MKNRILTAFAALLLPLATACAPAEDGDAGDEAGAAQSAMDAGNVVDVTAVGLTLSAPESIPSGWTTFRFANQSNMVHFAVVERMPEGRNLVDQQEIVAPIFQEGYDLLVEGETDAAMARFGELPEWFGEIVFLGGPGLTGPGRVSQATVYLEPGTYLLECYVKTDDVFHSYNPDPDSYGMVVEITVTDEDSGNPEPTPTVTVHLSSETGMTVDGGLTAGENTVAVVFDDQTVHENFVGHDVHVARLGEGTDLDALSAWMNWVAPDGLETPAPVQFIGGLNEMPAGRTGYFTVTLTEGDYALISEVPGSRDKGLLYTFTVN